MDGLNITKHQEVLKTRVRQPMQGLHWTLGQCFADFPVHAIKLQAVTWRAKTLHF